MELVCPDATIPSPSDYHYCRNRLGYFHCYRIGRCCSIVRTSSYKVHSEDLELEGFLPSTGEYRQDHRKRHGDHCHLNGNGLGHHCLADPSNGNRILPQLCQFAVAFPSIC